VITEFVNHRTSNFRNDIFSDNNIWIITLHELPATSPFAVPHRNQTDVFQNALRHSNLVSDLTAVAVIVSKVNI
jgi:hypothetical protein